MTYGGFCHARHNLHSQPQALPIGWPSFQHDDHVRLWKLKLRLEAFEAAAARLRVPA